MTTDKYGKYILKEHGSTAKAGVLPVTLEGLKDWGGISHRMEWQFVTAPAVLMDTPHRHDFDEFLVFLSCTPADELNFEAEIELGLGPDGEKQVITAPTIVCVPKGLVHGPLEAKSVTKPVLFSHIYLSPEYRRLPA